MPALTRHVVASRETGHATLVENTRWGHDLVRASGSALKRVGRVGALVAGVSAAAALQAQTVGATGAVIPAVSSASATGAVASPSTEPVATLDVPALLRLAVQSHPSVESARLEVDSAGRLTQAARMQFLPTPSLQAESLSGRTATVARLTQPIWTGGRLTADLRYSEVRELRAQEVLAEARMTLSTRVVNVVQGYMQQSGRRAVQERAVATLNDLIDMIDRRAAAEVSARSDLNLVRSRHAQARSELELYLGSEKSALEQLGRLVAAPVAPRHLRFDSSVVAYPHDGALLERAMRDNPAVRLAEIDARLAAIDVDRARAAVWPTLAVRAERQFGNYPGSAAPGSRVYLSLQYAPSGGLGVLPQIESTQLRSQAAERSVETARRDVADRVESDARDLEASLRRIPDLARARQGAADVLESSRRLFVTGRRSWIDLLNSARELTQAEQAEVDARAVAFGAYYRIRLATGVPVWLEEKASS